jgi:predicted secreted protein
MSSNAISGVGTKFRRWDSSSSEWKAIAEVNSIDGPNMSRDTIDVTSLDTTGGYREFIAGFRDPGQLQLAMNYSQAGFEAMKDDFESDVINNYQIVLMDGFTLEFEGLVTELPLSITPDDKITMNTVIKISGAVTVDSGSGS